VRSLAKSGLIQAVVSSTPRQNIDLILGALRLGQYFSTIVAGEDVSQGKPSPEGFLLAARRLRARPQRVLVVEDSVAGVRAARAAGMRCLAVATTHPREHLAEADLVVDTLEEVTVHALLGLG